MALVRSGGQLVWSGVQPNIPFLSYHISADQRMYQREHLCGRGFENLEPAWADCKLGSW